MSITPKKKNDQLKRHLAMTLSPVLFAEHELGLELDPWQREVLMEDEQNLILNCSRQAGKSTITAVLGLHTILYRPDSLVIVVSPSDRQSAELLRKVRTFYDNLNPRPKLAVDSSHVLAVKGGGRMISLPSSEDTIRGFSAVDLVIEDEASRVDDELFEAVKPMVAVSQGRVVLMSTPFTEAGHFYEVWTDYQRFQNWRRIQVPATDIPRISPEFLEAERREMGTAKFNREYMCEFLKPGDASKFKPEWFKFTNDYPRKAKLIRYWDRASTEVRYQRGRETNDPDYTVGCLMAEYDGVYYVLDVKRDRLSSKGNEDLIRATAELDGYSVPVRMEEEPGSSGKDTIDHYARRVLKGFNFKGVRSTGSKVVRAEPMAAAAEAGNLYLVRGDWDMPAFVDELTQFPGGPHDDQVDAASGAFNELSRQRLSVRPMRLGKR